MVQISQLLLIVCWPSVGAVVWSDCPKPASEVEVVGASLRVFSARSALSLVPANAHTTCANYSVPLDWESTPAHVCEGSEPYLAQQRAYLCIDFFVKRISLNSSIGRSIYTDQMQNKPALWLLAGGPGGSGQQLLSGFPGISTLLKDFDLLLPDHRGVGHSSPLTCPLTSLKPILGDAACVAYVAQHYGDKIQHYTTTNAARDHAYAMQDVGVQNLVYGISYGTYLANRVLLVGNESDASYPKAVVLDGVCASDSCRSLATFETVVNRAGLEMLAYCDKDAFCQARFPHAGGAVTAYLELFEDVSSGLNICMQKLQGHADEMKLNVSSYVLAEVLGNLAAGWKSRPLALATIYRMKRCNNADLGALVKLFKFEGPMLFRAPGDDTPGPPLPPGFPKTFTLPLLGLNIEVSELWDAGNSIRNQTCEAIDEITRQSFFVKGSSPLLCNARKLWNRYTVDKYAGRYAAPKATQILLLNGDLDPATPVAWATHAASKYQELKVSAKLIVVPLSLHGTVFQAPVLSKAGEPLEDDACGLQLMQSFLRSGGADIDTTCMSKLAPIDWAGRYNVTKANSMQKFGTADIWGDKDDILVV